jgi:para-aminobenzoate synthetase
VESRPIKGTRPRGGTEEEDDAIRSELRGCTKDVAENLMVVDLVRSDLSRVCKPGTVHVPKLFSIETYATVHQMVTVVRGQLEDGVGAIGAVEHTFPMGSMTGAPKSRTMSLLEEIETGARGPYSGTMGYFSVNGAADLAVVIRTAHVTPRGVTVGAGGAITILSDPSEEWREMLLKARAVVDSTLEACRMAPSHMAKEEPQGARFGPSSEMS